MPSNLRLPTVTELLESPQFKAVRDRVSHSVVVAKARSYLDELRTQVHATATEVVLPTVADLAQRLAQRILQTEHSGLRPVINATGVLIEPRLGGTPLAASALDAMLAVAQDYASLQIDLKTGQPLRASQPIEDLLKELTGCEAALAVNSGPAATLLTLAALAAGREAIVARNQLLEAADGSRLSDLIAASGAILREVGASNNARADDYRQAINAHTAMLLVVEPDDDGAVSQRGAGASLAELAQLVKSSGASLIHDAKAASFFDLNPLGIPDVPVLADSLQAGAHVVLANGDKLSGPQCGLILGQRVLIEQIARHPLLRAVQLDRTTLAALAATLQLYRQKDLACEAAPLLQLWTTSVENLQNRAQRLAPQLGACACIASAEAAESTARLTGDASPSRQVPSWCVRLSPDAPWTVEALANALRTGRPAVIGRCEAEALVLDLRAVPPRQDRELVEAVDGVAASKES